MKRHAPDAPLFDQGADRIRAGARSSHGYAALRRDELDQELRVRLADLHRALSRLEKRCGQVAQDLARSAETDRSWVASANDGKERLSSNRDATSRPRGSDGAKRREP
jgi:hypothetical protein